MYEENWMQDEYDWNICEVFKEFERISLGRNSAPCWEHQCKGLPLTSCWPPHAWKAWKLFSDAVRQYLFILIELYWIYSIWIKIYIRGICDAHKKIYLSFYQFWASVTYDLQSRLWPLDENRLTAPSLCSCRLGLHPPLALPPVRTASSLEFILVYLVCNFKLTNS